MHVSKHKERYWTVLFHTHKTQLHFSPVRVYLEYIRYWSQKRNGSHPPAQTNAKVK